MLIAKFIKKTAKSYGWVYNFYYTNRNTGERLVKIGVSDDVMRRYKEVDKDLPGKLELHSKWLIWNPYGVESQIHKKYWQYKARPKGAGPKAGKDEFFNLPWLERGYIQIYMSVKALSFFCFWLLLVLVPLVIASFVYPEIPKVIGEFFRVFLR